jgi:hypothetical protein
MHGARLFINACMTFGIGAPITLELGSSES